MTATDMAKAVLELEAGWPDDDDGIGPVDRGIVDTAGLLLCAMAGSLGTREHRANLVAELRELTA